MAMGPHDRQEARRIGRLPRGLLDEGAAGAAGEEIRSLLWSEVGTSGSRFRRLLSRGEGGEENGRCGRSPAAAPRRAIAVPRAVLRRPPASFAAVPLMVKGEARGRSTVDNLFQERPITGRGHPASHDFAPRVSRDGKRLPLRIASGALDTIRTTQDRLVQSEKLMALGEMVARIAHEIKNPLTAIGGFARRIASPRPGRGAIPRAVRADHPEEVERLERIINETLYFSREMVSAFRIVNLNVEIREVLWMFREEFEEARISAVVDLSPDLPSISADPDQIRQSCGTSSRTPSRRWRGAAPSPSSRTSPIRGGTGVVLEVSDTGGGSRTTWCTTSSTRSSPRRRKVPASAPIVHAIVGEARGTIHLDNREGVGVAFSIFLPLFRRGGTGDRILEQMRKGGVDGSGNKTHPG